MSEYQYYEFMAIDRPLTAPEMAELRRLSTRATITPTSFTNEYHWGDFKGDPDALMERYFDAHCYVANWGTRELQLRFPKRALDTTRMKPYLVEDRLELRRKGDFEILTFRAVDEEGYWELDRDAEEWLPALVPLREDLMNGDFRALYLAWLAAAQDGFVDADALEPPVPAGLGSLTPSLGLFAELLMLGSNLIAAAAAGSGKEAGPAEPDEKELAAWIAGMTEKEKSELLIRAMRGDASIGRELHRRHREASKVAEPSAAKPTRSVSQLLKGAERLAKAEQKRARAHAAAERKKHLDALAARQEAAWREVEKVFAMSGSSWAKAAAYDEKSKLLRDLRELAERDGHLEPFEERLAALRSRYARKTSFWQRYEGSRRW